MERGEETTAAGVFIVYLFHFHLFFLLLFLNYGWLVCEYCIMIQVLPRLLNWEQEAIWLMR